ncbi:hypothetical protein [Pseudoalteromonas sp. MMG022]|uniref:hypothetical protein n=1 Tax=Pseudoalteromonas sp. MMG022 TaxID=2909978 RepID=UPI001F3296A6|nr:hypothetical protein [Pseudoalteromonas sp. MMG022]MCF6436680.1 hypothetical protein [Pseudoalteromonas sp. MMG022]
MINFKSLFGCLFACYLIPALWGNAQAQDTFVDAKIAQQYLWTHLVQKYDKETLDIEKSEQAIDRISAHLDSTELSELETIQYRATRALSLYGVNLKRLLSNISVDIAQAELAIKDIDFVLRSGSYNVNKHLAYTGGHTALHLLKYPDLAYKYWQQCAEDGHSGCMNIMAGNSFTGAHGLSVNIQESIKWHKKVYNTGTEYTCAGIYSANALAKVTALFPQINTSVTPYEWYQRRDTLQEALSESYKDVESCVYLADLALSHVLLSKESAATHLNYIEQALKLAKVEQDAELLKHVLLDIKHNKLSSNTLDTLSRIEDISVQCELAFSALISAKYAQNHQLALALENLVTSIDTSKCMVEHAFIRNLQSEGRWQTL